MEEKNYSKVPVFENGLAQPVFKFTDGKTGEKYDPATSSIVRYCVYVESDYDMDGDGKRDLVKAFIQVPRSAVEGNYGSLFTSRGNSITVDENNFLPLLLTTLDWYGLYNTVIIVIVFVVNKIVLCCPQA